MKTAERLSKNKARLVRLIENAHVIAWEADIHTHQFTYVSPHSERILGYPPELWLTRDFWPHHIHPDDREFALSFCVEHAKSDMNYDFEYRMIAADGRSVWLKDVVSIIDTPDGRILSGFMFDISSEKSAENFRHLADSMPQIVWSTNEKGRFDYINERWFQYTGADRANLNIDWNPYFHPDDRPAMNTQWHRACITGEPFELEGRIRNRTGKYRWFLIRATPVRGANGKIIRWYGSTTDIDEQHRQRDREIFLSQASLALGSSLDYRKTLDTIAELALVALAELCGVEMLNEDGQLELITARHVDPEKTPLAKELQQLHLKNVNAHLGPHLVLRTGLPELLPEITDKMIEAQFSNEAYRALTKSLHLHSGMTVPLKVHEKVLGTITFLSTSERDSFQPEDLATAEELAFRAALAIENSRLFADAIESRQLAERTTKRLSTLYDLANAFSKTLTCEQVAEVITKTSVAAIDATTASVFAVNRDAQKLQMLAYEGPDANKMNSWKEISVHYNLPVTDTARTGKPLYCTSYSKLRDVIPQILPDAAEHKSLSIFPLMVNEQVVGVFRLSYADRIDFDEGLRDFLNTLAEAASQAMERAMLYESERDAREKAESLAGAAQAASQAKSLFLATMSHEIRTPLSAILGFTELLKDANLSAEERTEYLDTISRSGRALSQVINDVLDLSKIEADRLKIENSRVLLQDLVSEVVSLLRLTANQKGLYIRVEDSSEIPSEIVTDPTRLRQILINVIGNAVKFTVKGGVTLKVHANPEERRLHFEVRDTGIGVSSDQRANLFQPFSQADNSMSRKFGGTGLGLVLSRRLARALGGDVELKESVLGQGCLFDISISLNVPTEPARIQSDHGAHKTGRHSLDGLNILIVDDAVDNRTLVERLLKRHGARVAVAENGKVGVDMALHDDFDVVLMDIQMPVLDGFSATRQLREHHFEKPIIAFTAHALEEDKARCQEAGCTGHITKPIDTGRLLEVLENQPVSHPQRTIH